MIGETLGPAARSLLAEVKAERGLRAYPFEQTVEPAGNVEAHAKAFRVRVDDAVRYLSGEYGPTISPGVAREAGIDVEALLLQPPTSVTESDFKTCAIWRTGQQWLFLACRHYSKGNICWSLLLLGAAADGDGPADDPSTTRFA